MKSLRAGSALLALALTAAAPAASADEIKVKVVGGNLAAPGQFPWMAAIVDAAQPRADYGQFCGGAVIAPKVVLTAAHCYDGGTRATETHVVVGRTRMSTDTDGERVPVTRLVRHPEYDPQTTHNDILLLQLERPVSVTPIALPSPEDAPLMAAGARTVVAGWGVTQEGGDKSDDLRFVRLTVRSHEPCRRRYRTLRASTQMCAGGIEGEDSCQGDSGGPLFAGQGADARILGIVSYGEGCARRGVPGVYTRVSGFSAWVQENTAFLNGDAQEPPPPPDPPRVRFDSLGCTPSRCTFGMRVTGRAPAGGILMNLTRKRTRRLKSIDRYFYARQVRPGRWEASTTMPVGRIKLYAFPLNADRDDVDGEGDVQVLRVTTR